MKNLLFTFFLACSFLLINSGFSQSFNIDLRNFEQVNETEFTFDAYIQNESGTPYTLFAYQFQLEFDPGIKNGGVFKNADLTVVGESDLTGINKPLSTGFTSVAAGRIQVISEQFEGTEVEATYLDNATDYKIDKFRVKLSKDGNTHNFADRAPDWKFNLTGTIVLTADNVATNNTTIIGPYYTTIARNKPSTVDDHNLGVRQLAGFFYTGNGGWNETGNWNNVTTLNKNILPGAHSNAILNGNVTIPEAVHASLLPDGGNGGEVTLLNGPILSTLTITKGDAANVRYMIPPGTGTYSAWAASHTIADLAMGVSVQVQAQTFDAVKWQSNAGGSFNGTTLNPTIFTMPANDVTINPLNAKSINFKASNHSKNGIYASLTIVPGASLTVDKLFNDNTNGAGAIRVVSDENGTGYLIHNNEGVLASVERYLSQGKYHYVSSPIVDAPYSIFQVWPAPSPPAFADFFEWDENFDPEPSWINLNHNAPSGTLNPGQGYAVAYSDADYTKEFVGELNVGSVLFASTYTPGVTSPYWNQRGFNLAGNPYPAALDAVAFINANAKPNSNIYGLYFWDEAAAYLGERNDYATYSLAGGVGSSAGLNGSNSDAPDGFIAPMQGFMLQVKSTPFNQDAAIQIDFTNAMRTTDEAYFYKEGDDRARIWLSVTGPQQDYNEVLVAFMDGAQVGLDQSDAEKLKGNAKLAFYSMLDGGDFVIQGLPLLNSTDSYEIPLGVDAGFAGQYTFDVQKIENFASETRITIEDRLAGTMINLRTDPQYVAQIANPGEIRDRFYLHFNGPTSVPKIDQKLTRVYAINNQIFIELSGNNKILDVEIFNTLGQTVLRTPVNATEAIISLNGGNVVYIVKVRTSQGLESHKILLR